MFLPPPPSVRNAFHHPPAATWSAERAFSSRRRSWGNSRPILATHAMHNHENTRGYDRLGSRPLRRNIHNHLVPANSAHFFGELDVLCHNWWNMNPIPTILKLDNLSHHNWARNKLSSVSGRLGIASHHAWGIGWWHVHVGLARLHRSDHIGPSRSILTPRNPRQRVGRSRSDAFHPNMASHPTVPSCWNVVSVLVAWSHYMRSILTTHPTHSLVVCLSHNPPSSQHDNLWLRTASHCIEPLRHPPSSKRNADVIDSLHHKWYCNRTNFANCQIGKARVVHLCMLWFGPYLHNTPTLHPWERFSPSSLGISDLPRNHRWHWNKLTTHSTQKVHNPLEGRMEIHNSCSHAGLHCKGCRICYSSLSPHVDVHKAPSNWVWTILPILQSCSELVHSYLCNHLPGGNRWPHVGFLHSWRRCCQWTVACDPWRMAAASSPGDGYCCDHTRSWNNSQTKKPRSRNEFHHLRVEAGQLRFFQKTNEGKKSWNFKTTYILYSDVCFLGGSTFLHMLQ